ncbi:hypothetical protein T484DRAFT_1749738 [Baffinella frigidus]|nr:hypothetical protein T484DRAFT_1749738 [Cryptophyta sp. CCMP2293]
MPPQRESLETVKGMLAEVTFEKAELVERLNAMNQRIEEETSLPRKVVLQGQWMREKERSLYLLNKMVASLQGLLEGDLGGELTYTHGSPASRDCSESEDGIQEPITPTESHPWAFSQAMRDQRTSSMYCMQMLVRECSGETTARLPDDRSSPLTSPP